MTLKAITHYRFRYSYLMISLGLFVLTLPLLAQDENLSKDAEDIDRQLRQFHMMKRRNVEQAENIIDQLLNKHETNYKVIFGKIEFLIENQGRVEDAMDLFHEKVGILMKSADSSLVKNFEEDHFRFDYAPLILKVKDRQISQSAYIPNVQIDFLYPSTEFYESLKPDQRARLDYIMEPEFSNAKRFHFVMDSTAGQYVIRLDYFPKSASEEQYRLVVDRSRRYLFEFSLYSQDTVEIYWDDSWILREWIPDDRIKLVYRNDFTLYMKDQEIAKWQQGNNMVHSEIPIPPVPVEINMELNQNQKLRYRFLRFISIMSVTAGIVISILLSMEG